MEGGQTLKCRITLSMLLLGAVLVIVVPGILANSNKTVASRDSVEIYFCTATPDTVEVPQGGNLHWVIRNKAGEDQDQDEYTVDFGNDTNNPIPGAQPVTSTQLDDKPHRVNAPKCAWSPGRSCGDFRYTLLHRKRNAPPSTRTPCTDPIVRVVHPILIGLLLQNLAISLTGLIVFILLAYVAYRTFARK